MQENGDDSGWLLSGEAVGAELRQPLGGLLFAQALAARLNLGKDRTRRQRVPDDARFLFSKGILLLKPDVVFHGPSSPAAEMLPVVLDDL